MNDTVSAGQVEILADGMLQETLRLVDHGPKCTVRNLFLVLFFAAARAASIFDACRRLRNAPTDQAVRNALVQQLPKEMPELERRLNLALQSLMLQRCAEGILGCTETTHDSIAPGLPSMVCL